MNTVNMPKFIADASVYKTDRHYTSSRHARGISSQLGSSISPAAEDDGSPIWGEEVIVIVEKVPDWRWKIPPLPDPTTPPQGGGGGGSGDPQPPPQTPGYNPKSGEKCHGENRLSTVNVGHYEYKNGRWYCCSRMLTGPDLGGNTTLQTCINCENAYCRDGHNVSSTTVSVAARYY